MNKELSKKKNATKFLRVYPLTYEKIRKIAFEKRITYPELLEELVANYK